MLKSQAISHVSIELKTSVSEIFVSITRVDVLNDHTSLIWIVCQIETPSFGILCSRRAESYYMVTHPALIYHYVAGVPVVNYLPCQHKHRRICYRENKLIGNTDTRLSSMVILRITRFLDFGHHPVF
jgi:hypothetical protein